MTLKFLKGFKIIHIKNRELKRGQRVRRKPETAIEFDSNHRKTMD
jgi:hypothetical protein